RPRAEDMPLGGLEAEVPVGTEGLGQMPALVLVHLQRMEDDACDPGREGRVPQGPHDTVLPMAERGLVAIAVPVHRPHLTPDGEISSRQLRSVLAYDTFGVAPEGLAVELGVPVRRFPRRFFRGRRGWSELVVSRRFHAAFADYQFLLIHQLDCLVFR